MPAPSDQTQAVDVTCPGCFHPQQWDAVAACPICHHRANAAEGRSGALLPVGTQLKGYVIGEKLGQGGFGITYRGFDLTLKMKVAIKEYYLEGHLGRQGPWTDVYAIAATLYFMVTGYRLPSAMDRKQAVFLQQPDPLKPAAATSGRCAMNDEAIRSVPPLAKGCRGDLKARVRHRRMEIPPDPPFSKG